MENNKPKYQIGERVKEPDGLDVEILDIDEHLGYYCKTKKGNMWWIPESDLAPIENKEVSNEAGGVKEKLYRFIKVSERNPTKDFNYHVRAFNHGGYAHNDTVRWKNNVWETPFEVVEWLEEVSENTVSGGSGEVIKVDETALLNTIKAIYKVFDEFPFESDHNTAQLKKILNEYKPSVGISIPGESGSFVKNKIYE